MTKLVFLDTETTSLRPDRRAWDIALIVRTQGQPDVEHQWFVDERDLDLANADLGSLKIGGFYERHPDYDAPIGEGAHWEQDVLSAVEEYTRGAILVGAVPNFDAEVLAARMRARGLCPAWHYHLVDVETLAAGAQRLAPPWGFDDLLAKYGLTYDEAEAGSSVRHTALGDARMVRDLYDAVLGTQAVTR